MPRRHRALARICPGAEETAVYRRSPAKSGYCRTELPLPQRGAGRSPEGIDAAGSGIRTDCGAYGLSRYLPYNASDPPECVAYIRWYRFDPLSQLSLTAPLLCKGSLVRCGAIRVRRKLWTIAAVRRKPGTAGWSSPWEPRGAGRSPEGIDAADSGMWISCGEHSTS